MPDMVSFKKEYYSGIKPKELAVKYNMPESQVYSYIKNNNLASKKSQIESKIENKVIDLIESRISKLTDKSLDILENIIDNSDNESNKLKAVSEILDLSGYKKSILNQNVKNFKETPDIPTEFIMLRNRKDSN